MAAELPALPSGADAPARQEALQAAEAAFLAAYGEAPRPPGGKAVVVVPALDEEPTVAAVVKSVPGEVSGLPVEVLVVDDGSGDGTSEAAAGAGATVCRLEVNLGQGEAFKLGYRLARMRGASVIVTADADGQFDMAELPRLLEPLLADEADLVVGSRLLGTSDGSDPVRHLGVVVFGRLVSLLTGATVTDPACGFRAMRAEVAERVRLRQPQYQSSELLIQALACGFRLREVPVTLRRRQAGASKKGCNLLYGWRFAQVVLGTWWRTRGARRRRRPA